MEKENLNDVDRIKHKLKHKLDHDRYIHTLGVAYTAASLAMCHGLDHNNAFLAGLLHDCAKCIPDDKKIEKCLKHNIVITETERRLPYLLHSKLGAYYAQHKYGIDDEDILNSITFHTTGRPAMSKLEQIIFISDYIEPKRNKANRLKEIRMMAFRNLDECTFMILDDTIKYLSSKGSIESIDRTTIETHKYYEKKIKKKGKKEENKNDSKGIS